MRRSAPPTVTGRHSAPSRHRQPSPPRRRSPARERVLGGLVAILLTASVIAATGLFDTPAGASTGGVSAAAWWRSSSPHPRHHHRHHRAAVSSAPGKGAATGTAKPTKAAAGTSTPKASGSTAAVPPASSTASGGAAGSSASPSSAVARGAASLAAGLPYSADSFFRRMLPDNTPVSSTSAQEVAWAKANNPDSYLKIRGAHGVGWGIAYALADCADPIYRIGASGSVPTSQQHLRTVGFHAPASAWQNIPQNGDAPFLIVDTCGTSARPGGLSVWGANAVVSGNTVNVSAAGSFAHDTNGLDRRDPASDSQLNERSRGVIPDSMVIRLDMLDRAIRNGTGLGYVLETFWVETDSAAGFASPMVGAEGGKAGMGAEGQRFRIKANIDLAARPGCSPTTNPVGLALARTLQENGSFLGDNSGSGSGIKTEQNADFPGLTADSLRGCMTWDDIEFLPPGWGA